MGFPLGYSELLLPKFLLQMVFLLGFIRRIISWAFNIVGLGDLVDSDGPWPDPSSVMHIHSQNHQNHHRHRHHHQQQKFQSVSAMLIQEILPVVRFTELTAAGANMVADSCAVCLYEFVADDEVRRLSNCRHVFHRCCLDRWMEHDQRTCPLCRAPLIPEEMQDAFNDRMWAAAGLPDSHTAELHENYSSMTYSPALSLGHHLISA